MDDDTVSIAESQSPPTPIQGFARPAKLAPAPYRGQLAEGRVPTPIHNSFFTNGALGIPRSSSDGSNMDLEDVPLQTVRSPMAPPPRRTTLRDHPMPSPIRESLLSPGIPLRSPGSLHSPGPFHSPTTSGSMETSIAAASQMSRLSMNGSENMDIDDGRGGEDSGIDMSPRKGRARSGALSTQKTRYVMGYRDDCDKCRAKVPGHFSHFLPV